MLLTKTVIIKWANKTRNWYEDKGYIFTKYGDEFEVNVEDLTKGSHVPVTIQCDYCLEENVENIYEVQWKTYCRKKGIKDACSRHISKKQTDLGISHSHPKTRYTKEQIKEKYIELYYELEELVPSNKDVYTKHKQDILFPSEYEIEVAFGSLTNLKEFCNLDTKINRSIYSNKKLIRLLKEHIDKNGLENINMNTFRENSELPHYPTYVNAFGNDLIKIIELTGYKLTEEQKYNINQYNIAVNITKDEATRIIYAMQKEFNRPLMYDDFRIPTKNTIGINVVKKYWRTMNKMKKALGLEILQDDMMHKHIDDFNLIKEDIINCCLKVYNLDNRKTIMYSDIDKYTNLNISAYTISKCCKENNTTLRKMIESNDFILQSEGNGLVHRFDDLEITKSSFELLFSNKLREYGYQYNKDYFRDIKYKTFIPNYAGLLDCDYEIYINNKIIYIELAGMLRDYEKKYKTPEIIPSKSKKKYAEKLNQKENMFIEENLNYFILFPSDLKEDNLDFLFKNKLNIYRKDEI